MPKGFGTGQKLLLLMKVKTQRGIVGTVATMAADDTRDRCGGGDAEGANDVDGDGAEGGDDGGNDDEDDVGDDRNGTDKANGDSCANCTGVNVRGNYGGDDSRRGGLGVIISQWSFFGKRV